MTLTDYQAKFIACELTRRLPPDSAARMAAAVAGAQVDLNPHQVDAALFAFASPLSKGAILADEVGLGKTIEAGLVISQRWAERKRRILVITPSNLRKQWLQELTEKFFLPCRILESKLYSAQLKQGNPQPFEGSDIVICSYQFARTKAEDVRRTAWDLAVIDEAHRLRNVYKPGNIIASAIKDALAGRHKLLLTATPLQNSLLELYGLVSVIDDHVFGDLKSFKEQYAGLQQAVVFQALKARLKPVCHRTLRRQVTAYVPYTKRLPLLEEFTPAEGEDRLYHAVSDYLQRPNLQALPKSQRSLITLVLRKLLASSTFAIGPALAAMSARLKKRLKAEVAVAAPTDELGQDYEALEATVEEWPEEEEVVELIAPEEREAIEHEVADLDGFASLAGSIQHNAKGEALLKALTIAFARIRELGALERAVIFTESCRTQSYLQRLLADSPFAEGIVLFNGSNTDQGSRSIYQEWLERHRGTDRIAGSRSADMRSALVDYFRERGRIMIATEAGAEGINLQFCSLVVNYDLPWNPQRIEQRIGRCHRYGQKHDVVVVNFLNRKNAADQRVFELLAQKLHLFEGVFGASDDVLGALDSGVDLERRIAAIYQSCRRTEEIQEAFDGLQLELGLEIDESMTRTRRHLLESFDDEVREKLRMRDADSKASLSRHERLLMQLTRHELAGHAEFTGESTFELRARPFSGLDYATPLGRYELPRRSGEAHLYRLAHPLAETLVARARARDLPPAEVRFDYATHEGKVSLIEPLVGQSGWLTAVLLHAESLDQTEEHLIIAGVSDGGDQLDDEAAERLLTLPGTVAGSTEVEPTVVEAIGRRLLLREQAIRRDIVERNTRYFEAEAEKLDGWAEDLKVGLEREIKELDRGIKEARREAILSRTLEEKVAAQKRIRALESDRNQRRRSLFEAQDQVDRQREELIGAIEGKMALDTSVERLFTVRWLVV